MSNQGSSRALEIACPECKQPIGEYCKKPNGQQQVIAHKKRRWEGRGNDWNVGYGCKKCGVNNLCDVCHEHHMPRGECDACPPHPPAPGVAS